MSELSVTCVIPTKKGRDTIFKAIDSVVAQTYRPIKIIIYVNDIDNEYCLDLNRTANMLAAETSIQVIQGQGNLNVVESFNAAMSYADTEFAFWLSDDDVIEPTYIEKLVNMLNTNRSAVGAFCDFRNFDIYTGKTISSHTSYFAKSSIPLLRYILSIKKINAMAVYGIYRKSHYKNNHLLFMDFFDVDYVLKAIVSGGVSVVKEQLISIGSKGVRVPYSIVGDQFEHLPILKSQFIYVSARSSRLSASVCFFLLGIALLYSSVKRRKYGVGKDPRA